MLNFAMLGAGRIAASHAKSFISNPNANLLWVADPISAASEPIAKMTGAKATTDPLEALQDPKVDAVLIASPTPTHVDLIVAATKAGKAVLCEKPIALDMDQVDSCLSQLKGLKTRVMMGFNRRFDPSFAAIHDRVTAGDLGDVEQIIVVSRDPAPPPPAYVAESGGLFKDCTIHDFDMVRFFLPDIVEVEAVGQNVIEPFIAEAGDFDGAITTLRAANGAIATIINSRRCTYGYDQRLEVFGVKGMLNAKNLLPNSVCFNGAEQVESTGPYLNFFLERYADAYAAELAAFIETVENGGEFSPSLEDGRAALQLAIAADEAARTGRTVKVGKDK